MTTDIKHSDAIATNGLARQFAVAAIPAPDRVWASDLTYTKKREGWLSLAVVLDIASRRAAKPRVHHIGGSSGPSQRELTSE